MRAAVSVLFLALLAACAHLTAPARPAGATLRVMTYNIRLDIASDGANGWASRKHLVSQLTRREAPDVLGMQEVLFNQKRDIEAALRGYAFAGVGRDDGAEAGEYSPVGWRRDRFELVESGTFWLSPNPEEPGKAWDAAYPRIATWVLLRDRTSGKRLRVINTHFDHVGTAARLHSAEMIADWTKRHSADGAAVVALGDFNSTADDPPVALLADPARSGTRLARAISAEPPYGPPGTFNAFRIDANEPAAIDHVLVSSVFAVSRHAVITQHWGGRLPSDHYPVLVDLVWR